MKTTLTQEEYVKLSHLVKMALGAKNQSEARRFINQIPYCTYGLTGNAKNILSSLVAYTENASGGGSDKEHRKYFVDMELYKLKDYISED